MRDDLPRLELEIPTIHGEETIEFIVDTGFDGELALPGQVLRSTNCSPPFETIRALAEASIVPAQMFEMDFEWNEQPRHTEILEMNGKRLLAR